MSTTLTVSRGHYPVWKKVASAARKLPHWRVLFGPYFARAYIGPWYFWEQYCYLLWIVRPWDLILPSMIFWEQGYYLLRGLNSSSAAPHQGDIIAAETWADRDRTGNPLHATFWIATSTKTNQQHTSSNTIFISKPETHKSTSNISVNQKHTSQRATYQYTRNTQVNEQHISKPETH